MKKSYLSTIFFLSLTALAPLSKSYGEKEKSKPEQNKVQHVGHCLTAYISVYYNDPEDYEIACEGLKRVEKFFKNHFNQTVIEPVQILFGDNSLFIDNDPHESVENVSGLYIPMKSTVILYTWKIQKQKNYFNRISFSKNIHSALVVHELTHHIHYTHIKKLDVDFDELGSEFLAMIIQLETMKNPEKNEILSYFKEKKSSSPSMNKMNLVFYMLEPWILFKAAHSIYLKTPHIIQDIFNGKKFGFSYSAPYQLH